MDEKRQSGRKEFFVDVVLGTDKAHYVVQGKNLSEAGIFLTMRRALPVGTELKIAFGNPPRLPMIRAFGGYQAAGWRQGSGHRIYRYFRL